MLTPERLLTQERLKELLDYDPETGVFTWKVDRGYTAKAGTRAGYIKPGIKGGYRLLTINDVKYRACRVAFLWMTGKMPENQCDHRDLDQKNDSWDNLRESTQVENSWNKRAQSNNKLGLKGVCEPSDRPGKFWATIQVHGKRRHLGEFTCPAAAHLAYVVAAHESFGAFARSS